MEFSELVSQGIVKVRNDGIQSVKISDLIGKKLTIHDYNLSVSTKFGNNRCVIYFSEPDSKVINKFYTNSNVLKDTIIQIPKDKLPFNTIIIKVNGIKNDYYKFT